MTVADAGARAAALDVHRSFCVSAPAGSGKTELLIQRYLALLARVERPEQVLAITFTRKAAAEMRERVMQALWNAQQPAATDSEHQLRTRALAKQALDRDRARNWGLLRDISRLNIRTIDGFCSALTRQMPVLSDFGGQANAVDDASGLYQEAVAGLFELLDSQLPVATDLAALMLHFDNNWDRLRELLVSMLARRDQWRDYVGVHHSPQESEQYLLTTVQAIVRDNLADLGQQLAPVANELFELQCYAATNLGQAEPPHSPRADPADLTLWRALGQLLLTKAGTWRRTVNKTVGFPTGKGRPAQYKDRMCAVLAELSTIEGLERALSELNFLPAVSRDSDSWQLVLHLSRILPMLAAQLLLVFQRRSQVDHSQVAMSALQALGEDDTPTDLALRLDYQLEHILVDEFQDTAINQYELVRRLTRGWAQHNALNPGAPRTLLIVGDGMQSIYGFRDANVGLFLRARDEGFNGVALEYVELRCNFRSEAGVVDWINQVFRGAFPALDNIARSEVSFTDALAVKPAGSNPPVSVHGFYGDDASQREVEFICAQIAHALMQPDCGSIAILGRSRPQLQPVLAGLRNAGIPYLAQDVNRLAQAPIIMDLLSLCRALANNADRLAWAAVLRAPWCGLLLPDLHTICRYGEPARYTPLSAALADRQLLACLSADGARRAQHVALAMEQAHHSRDRLALRVWVEQAWLQLQGPACATGEAELRDAQQFFQLLEQAEVEGLGLDIPWLEHKLERLYANAGSADARVQLMTLHKAKGLEFDTVFIPSMARSTRGDDRPLLLWDEYSSPTLGRGFLLAADDHSANDVPGLYNFLRQQRKRKTLLETTRLLYVGATRAVQRLVLTGRINYDETREQPKPPSTSTLLGCIWDQVSSQLVLHAPPLAAAAAAAYQGGGALPLQRLQHLPEPRLTPASTDADRNPVAMATALLADNRFERHVGTVVHWALEQLAQCSILPASPDGAARQQYSWQLQQLGLHGAELEEAIRSVYAAVTTTLADPRGRWLLDCEHSDCANELRLTQLPPLRTATELTASARIPADIVIDRTFVDAESGERWIIDYKTATPLPAETLADFCLRQARQYQQQLTDYRDAIARLGPQPIRCALYFTGLGHLHELSI